MLEASVRPTQPYPYPFYLPSLCVSRQEGRNLCRPRKTATVWGGCKQWAPEGCIFDPSPTVPDHPQQQLVLGRQWAGWCTHRQYSKLLRCHRQWCPSSAASPLSGRLTLSLLQRSLCLLYSCVTVYEKSSTKSASQDRLELQKDHHHTLLYAHAQTSER